MSTTPRHLGKYALQELLGRGGMAEVWKAFDTQLQRYVAIKLLHANLQADPDFITRFTREAQMIAGLRHPNIVQIYDFHVSEDGGASALEADTIAYMVMEYIRGQTLAHYIYNTSYKKQFPPTAEIIRLFTPISLAVDYAHQQGMIHRDIKPANILLDQSHRARNPMGEPILSDFGLAKLLNASSQTATGVLLGTPLYISPEQAHNRPVTKQADIYALGVVLYEIFTGVPPFQGESVISILMQHLTDVPTEPHLVNPNLPPALSEVLLKGLSKNPLDRFPSASAMIAAVAEAFNMPIPEDLKQGISTMENTNLSAEQTPLLRPSPGSTPFSPPAAHIRRSSASNYVTLAVSSDAEAVTSEQNVLSSLPPGKADFPPPRTFSARSNNLPTLLTPLIGREQEVVAVCAQIQRPEVRLVTLLGPGGIGKTHLSLQIATEMQAGFVHGVCFVPLASVSDPGQIFATIAQALGLQPAEARSPLAQVQAHLRDKHMLLLLDNFEQLISAAPTLADLLACCPQLHLLVTSRAALRIHGEYEFTIPPLAVPDLTHLPENEDLAQVATVALFLQRAQAVQSGFQLTKANARAIAEICTRLDGLPLAIELAAARIKLLPPKMLLKRLANRLDVLTGSVRNLPARQQTMRNTIQWSYDLLSSEEQRLFRWLSVFAGGCTLEAADAVYNAKAEQAMDVLERVASLLDMSLLRQTEQEDGELRLSMLETIREYGLECLVANGELEVAQQSHAAYYLALAQEAEPYLTHAVGIRRRSRNRRNPAEGAEQVVWLKRLEREYENLRAALQWSAAHGDEEMKLALRLSSGLLAFWIWTKEPEK